MKRDIEIAKTERDLVFRLTVFRLTLLLMYNRSTNSGLFVRIYSKTGI